MFPVNDTYLNSIERHELAIRISDLGVDVNNDVVFAAERLELAFEQMVGAMYPSDDGLRAMCTGCIRKTVLSAISDLIIEETTR